MTVPSRVSADNLVRYVGRVTHTRAGAILFALLASYVLRRFFARRARRSAAVSRWSNPSQEVAVITGGSGGIGIEVAKHLSARGVKVAIIDIVSPKDDVVLPSEVRFYKSDLTDYESILAASKEIEKELGPVTILINNAGVANDGPSILEFDSKQTERTINVNLTSHFYTLKIFLPHMIRKNHGHIMSTASAGSFVMPAGGADYGAAKAGLISLHETLQVELDLFYQNDRNGQKGVLCSIVHPHWIATPLTKEIFAPNFYAKMIQPELVGKQMAEKVLSGRGGSLYIPGWVGNLAWLRVLPHGLAHKIRMKGSLDLQNARRQSRPAPAMP